MKNVKHRLTSIKIPREYEASFATHCIRRSIKRFNLFANIFYFFQILSVVVYMYCYRILGIDPQDFNEVLFAVFSSVYMLLILANVGLINYLGKHIEVNKYFLEISFVVFLTISYVGQLINLYFDIQTKVEIYRFMVFICAIGFLPVIHTKKIKLTIALMSAVVITVSLVTFINNEMLFSAFHFFAVIVSIVASTIISLYQQLSLIESFIGEKTMQEANSRLEEVNRQLNEMNDKLERLSVTDPLTQISNRRAFDDYIERMWHECRRLHKPMTVMMMDIDHFKAFNDFFGHVEGDECLKAVSETIRKNFNRSTDMFARYGGEEFVAVLPFSEGESALVLAERIRADIENLKIPNPKSKVLPTVTISIGVAGRTPAHVSEQLQNHEWIVALADKALYDAKAAGRNRIVANLAEDTEDSYLALGIPHMKPPGPGEDLEKLQVIVQATMISVFSVDLVSGSMEFSKEIIAYIGDDKCKFDSYRDFSAYIYEGDREIFEKTMLDLFAHCLDTTTPVLFRLKCGDDEYSWVSLAIRYMYDGSFNVVSAVGAISDYSKQMREQEMNKLMAQGSANYLFSYNYEDKCAQFSQHFMNDFDIASPVVENAAVFFYNLIYDADKKLFLQKHRNLIKNKTQIAECTIRAYRPSRGVVWLHFRAMLNRDYKNKPYMLAGSLTDVTEYVETNRFNSLIVEGCADCVFILDVKTDICQFSSGINKLVNMPDPIITDASKTWMEFVIPEDRKTLRASFKAIFDGKTDTHKLEYRVIGANGAPLWIACRGKASFDEDGNASIIAGSILNISAMGQYNRYNEKLL